MNNTEITIARPDDWHLHLRDGDMMKTVLPDSSRHFGRAIIMPNLVPPLINTADILNYKKRIQDNIPEHHNFEPMMTAYLSDSTDPNDLVDGFERGIIEAVKLYPANATTNSANGVSSIEKVYHVLEAMERSDVPLLIHGEVTGAEVDIFDRESQFVDTVLQPLTEKFSSLRMVVEHVTTQEAAEFVMAGGENIAATVTPQHLLYDRNALLVGGIKPHNYCLPILKREKHRLALVKAVTSKENSKFFLGTDSAPHETGRKESSCGCAGAYNSLVALSVYATIFEKEGAIEQLEAFTSLNGPKFYKKPVNSDSITLVKEKMLVPEIVDVVGGGTITPFLAGQTLDWSVK